MYLISNVNETLIFRAKKYNLEKDVTLVVRPGEPFELPDFIGESKIKSFPEKYQEVQLEDGAIALAFDAGQAKPLMVGEPEIIPEETSEEQKEVEIPEETFDPIYTAQELSDQSKYPNETLVVICREMGIKIPPRWTRELLIKKITNG